MAKTKIRFFHIVFWLVVIAADFFIYLFLGILLMGYDDNYDSSKGEYWSLASMNSTEKIIYFCYNGWIVLNIIAFAYLAWRIYKRQKSGTY